MAGNYILTVRETMEQHEENILEHELLMNERVVEHSHYGKVRLRRPTPAIDRMVAEEKRRSYHKDLRDKDILTRKEVEKILEERGIWSDAKNKRIKELTALSGEMMGRLSALGYDSVEQLFEELLRTQADLRLKFGDENAVIEDAEIEEAIRRLFDLDENLSLEYGMKLRDASTSTTIDDLITKAEQLRLQGDLVKLFAEAKEELDNLTVESATYFVDTVEERANRVERMAQLYYCATNADTDEPLWSDFDSMWHERPTNLNWLLSKMYYFENGITDEFAEMMQKYGFMARVVDISNSSESSPDHPKSNSDGNSPESEPQNSSQESEAPTS